jgi:hypothetical protein
LKNPLEGYRRLAFMMLDADIVAVRPSSVWRVLSQGGLLLKWNGKLSKKGTGFEQPLAAHQHWHIDVSYINISGTFYYHSRGTRPQAGSGQATTAKSPPASRVRHKNGRAPRKLRLLTTGRALPRGAESQLPDSRQHTRNPATRSAGFALHAQVTARGLSSGWI